MIDAVMTEMRVTGCPLPNSDRPGFTLIELLVVITIIVVLLSLLTPALDKAIYQAELATCMANLHGIGRSASTYSANFKRRYPYRQKVAEQDAYEAHKLTDAGDQNRNPLFDLRVIMKDYMPVKMLVDPLLGEVDLDIEATPPATSVYADYNLWFGYGYHGNRTMAKLGDRWSWQGISYNILGGCVSDLSTSEESVRSVHPDDEGAMSPLVRQGVKPVGPDVGPGFFGPFANHVWERYVNQNSRSRGAVDLHFVTSDGGVNRYIEVEDFEGDPDEALDPVDRFDWVPLFSAGDEGGGAALGTWRMLVPRN